MEISVKVPIEQGLASNIIPVSHPPDLEVIMATASKPAASKPKASTAKSTTSGNKDTTKTETSTPSGGEKPSNAPAERTGKVDTTTVDSSTSEVPTNAAGEIALPDSKEIDKEAAKDAEAEGDKVDEIQKAQEDSVRSEIERDAQAVKDNPDHPEEEIPEAFIVGGEVPVNAPGTEGYSREQ